ncbi:MAG: LPXTG cell wall anchor domain-containing protein, partial [Ruminococcus sp.]|nr:LPXTG cell wall anchor domain-containing protein [Ruminococcus sp.]
SDLISIGATHKEQTGTTVDLTLTGIGEGVENSIVDTMNNTLPSTGGVGTTLFYLGGGAMVAVAGVYLISKKRMKNED